jgi:hypothetical protein
VWIMRAWLTCNTNKTNLCKDKLLLILHMQRYKLGRVTLTLDMEHCWQRKGTRNKDCHMYMRWSRVLSLIHLAVPAKPRNVLSNSRPYIFFRLLLLMNLTFYLDGARSPHLWSPLLIIDEIITSTSIPQSFMIWLWCSRYPSLKLIYV